MAGLKGFEAWVKYTDKVTRKTRKEIEKEVRKVGEDIVRDAKAVVPVDTGRLKKSINYKLSPDRLSVKVGTDVYYSMFVEFGTYKMPARPYLTPAIARHAPRLTKGVEDAVKYAFGSGVK